MSKKANATKDKPKSKSKQEEEPAPDLLTKDGTSLMSMINEFKNQLVEVKSKRNYVQNERDLLDQFSRNTRKEIEELKCAVTNKEADAEQLETDHRVEVKVYLQKVKHMEYDRTLNARQANQEGDQDMKKEDEYHADHLREMQKDKTDAKRQYNKSDESNQQEIKQVEQQHKKTLKLLGDEYDKKIQTTEEKYEETLKRLKDELELKLKVEIHEIEERKNQHLNELMRNHDAAFGELKAYYIEITRENLELIKSQKQRLEELQASLIVNGKLISEIKAKNKQMEDPLEKNRKLRDELKYALRLHEKDKMALSNLKIKLKSLLEKITKLEKEQDLIDKRYAKVLKDRKDLETRFGKITNEVKQKADAKNVVLSQQLEDLNNRLDMKEAQLQHLVRNSQLDPNVVENLCSKIQVSLESKNGLIKNLQYSIHHATKAYNDAIRVYESKLTQFGIPVDELGFQALESKTSVMPAGLVSSQ